MLLVNQDLSLVVTRSDQLKEQIRRVRIEGKIADLVDVQQYGADASCLSSFSNRPARCAVCKRDAQPVAVSNAVGNPA